MPTSSPAYRAHCRPIRKFAARRRRPATASLPRRYGRSARCRPGRVPTSTTAMPTGFSAALPATSRRVGTMTCPTCSLARRMRSGSSATWQSRTSSPPSRRCSRIRSPAIRRRPRSLEACSSAQMRRHGRRVAFRRTSSARAISVPKPSTSSRSARRTSKPIRPRSSTRRSPTTTCSTLGRAESVWRSVPSGVRKPVRSIPTSS